MKVREVCEVLEQLAPKGFAFEWDRVGLLLGDAEADVSTIVTALSFSPESVDAALEAGAQLLVTHHPPIWEPLRALCTADPATQLLLRAAQAGLACYNAHTNLDVVPGGVNAGLAERVGLENTRVLLPVPQAAQVKLIVFVPESHIGKVRDGVCEAGAGIIGNYTYCTFSSPGTGTFIPGEGTDPFSGTKYQLSEEPERKFEVLVPKARLAHVLEALAKVHPYDEPAYDLLELTNPDESIGLGLRGDLPEPVTLESLANHVRQALGIGHVRVVGDANRRVQHVAVLGGSGGSEIGRIPDGIDVFITGDVKYHDALDAEARGLAVIDAGHHGTEIHASQLLANYLTNRLPGLTVKDCEEHDPFRALTE